MIHNWTIVHLRPPSMLHLVILSYVASRLVTSQVCDSLNMPVDLGSLANQCDPVEDECERQCPGDTGTMNYEWSVVNGEGTYSCKCCTQARLIQTLVNGSILVDELEQMQSAELCSLQWSALVIYVYLFSCRCSWSLAWEIHQCQAPEFDHAHCNATATNGNCRELFPVRLHGWRWVSAVNCKITVSPYHGVFSIGII